MRKNSTFLKRKGNSSLSFFDKVVSIIKVIRIELFIALMALIISVGQYFQNSITARINITSTWRQGYTSEVRDRVTRFIYIYKSEKENCKGDTDCIKNLKDSIDKIVSVKKLYDAKIPISQDFFIQKLVANEIKHIKRKEKFERTRTLRKGEESATSNDREPENEEYIEIVLKYKNAIIECLNTLEAVRAVIQSKPLPFRISIFYKDTLEGRYKDIIEELRDGLMDFIEAYRKDHPDRETEAWYVLTSDESYLNDLINVILYFLIFTIGLVIVYLIKTRMQQLGYIKQ